MEISQATYEYRNKNHIVSAVLPRYPFEEKPITPFITHLVTPALAVAISERLTNNSSTLYAGMLGNDHAYSSFYSFDEHTQTVTIDWVFIPPHQGMGTHAHLRSAIDYSTRRKNGVVRSGHIGAITLENRKPYIFALFDTLDKKEVVDRDAPEHPIITTMMHHHIVPITAIGYPIGLEQ